MEIISKELLVIGGGPAGLAAAHSAYEDGIKDLLIIERDVELGGILNQCIHNGFGLHTFKEELTGPEYADRFITLVEDAGIDCLTESMVISLSAIDEGYEAYVVSKKKGMFKVVAKAVILAMGCRERSRGALNIPGFRPAGVFSAGTAQRMMNMDNKKVGKDVVILGSGDIGLIMARRMTLEGSKVHCVLEAMPYSGGLKRNIVQCLDDFHIPLHLSHTIVDIKGKDRVTSVVAAEIDENMKPIEGTEIEYPCDTILFSVGLIPENEISLAAGVELSKITNGPKVNESMETNLKGVFACGNVLHVHDLVDYVSEEAKAAGHKASQYLKALRKGDSYQGDRSEIEISPSGAVRYTVPTVIDPNFMDDGQIVRFRVSKEMKTSEIRVFIDGNLVDTKKKKVMAPGEMESVKLKKSWFEEGASSIEIQALETA